jgi:hypothetical protein
MRALRNFSYATARTLRQPPRTVPTAYHRARAGWQHPTRRIDSPLRVSRRWVVVRALRIGAEALFGFWVIAALAFCTAVAVALVR